MATNLSWPQCVNPLWSSASLVQVKACGLLNISEPMLTDHQGSPQEDIVMEVKGTHRWLESWNTVLIWTNADLPSRVASGGHCDGSQRYTQRIGVMKHSPHLNQCWLTIKGRLSRTLWWKSKVYTEDWSHEAQSSSEPMLTYYQGPPQQDIVMEVKGTHRRLESWSTVLIWTNADWPSRVASAGHCDGSQRYTQRIGVMKHSPHLNQCWLTIKGRLSRTLWWKSKVHTEDWTHEAQSSSEPMLTDHQGPPQQDIVMEVKGTHRGLESWSTVLIWTNADLPSRVASAGHCDGSQRHTHRIGVLKHSPHLNQCWLTIKGPLRRTLWWKSKVHTEDWSHEAQSSILPRSLWVEMR